MKTVVFDLDETLGSFVEFGIFWDCLNRYLSKNTEIILSQQDFNVILDLYPEFLRPNIIEILNYLKEKKQSECCDKLMIYTNNQGDPEWAQRLRKYFENKINYTLFDQIIAAFKINGKRIEICRTSHDKSYHDLVRCSKIPVNAEICFIDDNYFPGMYNKNVYYINLKPYTYDLLFETIMVDRFLNNPISKKWVIDDAHFKKFMNHEFVLYNYTYIEKQKEEHNVDMIISKQILFHLHEFFEKSLKYKIKKGKTRKPNIYRKNRTHKKILKNN